MSLRTAFVGGLLACSSLAVSLSAQPETDIFLVPILRDAPTLQLGIPENITDRDGYDNQPQFTADGSGLLFSSMRDGATDVFVYQLSDRMTRRLTNTPESEYSPTPTRDETGFTVVRVEADSTQRLWFFPYAGGSPTRLLPEVHPVGYHAWGSDSVVALFVLGEPPTLEVVQTGTGLRRTVASRVGRSIQKIPLQKAISYVQLTDTVDTIERYDLPAGAVETLVETLEDIEHHAWMPDGTTILMARGSSILSWEPAGRTWTAAADFSSRGVGTISRIAVSPRGDWLAFVAER